MIAPFYGLILLLPYTGGSALPGGLLCIGIPHQACVETPLQEVYLPGDPGLDLFCPPYTQRIFKNDMGKDDGPLRVPGPPEYPPPFRCQYCRKAVPHMDF